jgi:DNA-binding transcriptional regulator YbjK
VKLLNHRKVSLKNLETIRNRRLQRRVSSISDEPSMEVITALIVEAYVDICKRLEHLQQIYDEGLEWLKFNR